MGPGVIIWFIGFGIVFIICAIKGIIGGTRD